MSAHEPPPTAGGWDDVFRVRVTEYLTFYEVVDGALLRRMEPIELTCRRGGGGATRLVCLHSVTAASRFADGLLGALDGYADVLSLDLRGFGDSPRPTHDYTVDLWVQDVLTVLANTGFESAVLYGHGLGACVALALAARGIGTGVAVSGVALAPGEPAALAPLAELAERGDDLIGPLEELTGADPEAGDLTPQIVSRCIRAWLGFDGLALPARVAAPILVVSAAQDRVAGVDVIGGPAWLAAAAADARRVNLDGAHELPRLQPLAMARALTEWLDEVEVRRRDE